MSTPDRTDRTTVLIIGLIAPLIIVLACAAMMVSWIPSLPNPVAIHWSSNGVDGFGSVWMFVLMPVAITIFFCVVAFTGARATSSDGSLSVNTKFLLVTSLFLSTFLGLGMLGALEGQRGLVDAANAPDIGLPMLLAAVAGVVLATVGWFVLPESDGTRLRGEDATAVEAERNERLYWSRSVTLAPRVAVFVAAVVLGSLVIGIVVFLAAPERGWFAVLPLLIVTALVFLTPFWRVSVDWRGFSVRAPLGWPRVVIPVEDIAEVRVVDINPSADFGGWGWRWALGRRTGIILRHGPGIEIARHDGRRFVVTVNEAAVGAGVVKTLTARRRAAS
jgi:hypothetical protein